MTLKRVAHIMIQRIRVKFHTTIIQHVLSDLKEGEVLRISSGCLVGFQEGVQFDVQMIPGVSTW